MKHALLVCLALLEVSGLPIHADTAAVTAISGPNACFAPPGYSAPSVCTVAGETPLASFHIPSVGGSYVDANLGGTVRVLSAAPSNHDYSTPSPYSATGKYVAIAQGNVQVNVLEAATGRVIYTGRPGNVTGDSLRWDAYSDEVYYYFSGSKVMKHTLSTNQTTVLVDYSIDGHGLTNIGGGGTGDTTKDNWLGFWTADQHKVCAINLTTVKTFCADYTAPHPDSRVGYNFIDFVLVSKGVDSVSHKRYVLLMAAPAAAVFSVNESTGNLDWEYRGPEMLADMAGHPGNNDGVCDPNESCFGAPHSDVFEDTDGQQYIMYAADVNTPCGRFIGTLRLNAGKRLLISTASGGGRSLPMTLHPCGLGPYEAWVDDHWGCARNSAYCVLSTTYWGYRNPADLNAAIPATSYLDEVMVIRGNGVEVRRIAKNRSVQFTNDNYWSTPRAAISPDGSAVLWDTNFGYPNRGEYVVTANTNFGGPAAPPPPVPVVALTNPSAGANVTGTVMLSATITSAAGIASVQFLVDGAAAGALSTSPFTFAWDTTRVGNGAHTLSVVVTDTLGRTAATPGVPVNVSNSTAATGFTSIHINAGGPVYTDPQGVQWAADRNFSGGSTFSVTQPIAGTATAALYQTCRYGVSFSYTIAVPNGSYSVTLKFAEPSFTAAGRRSFNVSVNGTAVLQEFDIFQQAGGALRAIDRTFPVTVNNGQIVVLFTSGRANAPMVNAIEVVQGAATSGMAIRVNAGGSAFVDPSGRTWAADNGFSGGFTWSVTKPILSTDSAALYQSCRWGNAFSYAFSVSNGNYNVTLKFAEPTFTIPGQRYFNAAINGALVLSNFDIVAQAGPLRAVDKTFPVSVSNGRIVIQFSKGNADAPMVSGIEILAR